MMDFACGCLSWAILLVKERNQGPISLSWIRLLRRTDTQQSPGPSINAALWDDGEWKDLGSRLRITGSSVNSSSI